MCLHSIFFTYLYIKSVKKIHITKYPLHTAWMNFLYTQHYLGSINNNFSLVRGYFYYY